MLPSLTRCSVPLTPTKPNWICTIVWTSLAILLGLSAVSGQLCTGADLFSLQKPCRKQNDDLVSHIGTNHSNRLCNAFKDVLYCVAKNMPRCIHNVTEMHQHLTHSPHNCHIDGETLIKIQTMVNEAAKARKSTTTTLPKVTTRQVTLGDKDDGYSVTGDQSGHTGNAGTSTHGLHVWHLFVIGFLLHQRLPVLC